MHEYHLAKAGKDEVGASGQPSDIKPIAISHAVDEPAYGDLRRSVAATHSGHDL
jgi:hypothetical protein